MTRPLTQPRHHDRCKIPAKMRQPGRPKTWTREAVIDAHRAEGQRLGRPPYAVEYSEGNPRLPSYKTVTNLFGAFSNLCRAAGETPRTKGWQAPPPGVSVSHPGLKKECIGRRPDRVTTTRHYQVKNSGKGIHYAALVEFRKVTAHLFWPGPHYRIQRERMKECCQAYDEQMAREASRRKGGRPSKPGKPRRVGAAAPVKSAVEKRRPALGPIAVGRNAAA